MIDWRALATTAKRANAAYVESDDASKAAFAALGDVWVAQFQDDSRQAVLSVDQTGETWLSISGTRASQGQLLDVYRDTQLKPTQIKGGTVTLGVCDGMDHVFDWALSTAPAGTVINITGHSLGSTRCQIAPAYVPAEQIGMMVGFAAPKFIARDFFQSHAAAFQRLIPVLNASDGWASWPWIDRRWQYRAPVQTVWLKSDQGALQMLTDGNQWPGGWRFSDHNMDTYQTRVEAIAAASVKPAA